MPDKKQHKKSNIKPSKRESYWQLFARFCFVENESKTYTELIDRVNFYNSNQTFLKKIPTSATPQNACLLLHTRKLFFGRPKEIPNTQYDYLYWLVEQLCFFDEWLQDNFKFYHGDSMIPTICAMLKPSIPKRFGDLNPEVNLVEEQGMLAVSMINYQSTDLLNHAIETLDEFRKTDELSFTKLHCMLGNDFLPIFSLDDIKDKTTLECVKYVSKKKEEQDYDFTWRGKDIAKMMADVPTTSTLKPCKDESKDFDTTHNLYCEGDNLRVMKVLLPSYKEKVKMIYIDPPYNTGKNFVFKDNHKEEAEIFSELLLSEFPKVNYPPAKAGGLQVSSNKT